MAGVLGWGRPRVALTGRRWRLFRRLVERSLGLLSTKPGQRHPTSFLLQNLQEDPGIVSSAVCQVAGELENHRDLLFIPYALGTV